MPASDQHPQYANNLQRWELIRDCVDGSQAIKTRQSTGGSDSNAQANLHGLAGTRYLPAPNPEDNSTDNISRYSAYKKRANFVNFTGHTKEGMLGMVFRKDAVFEPETSLGYLADNADGGGLTLDQMLRGVTGEVLMLGRYGILVDYPSAPEGLTQAQVTELGLRANILTYPAESVVNWRTDVIGGVRQLVLVVVAEDAKKYSEDGFKFEIVKHHRILRFAPVGDGADGLLFEGNPVYHQFILDEDDKVVPDSFTIPRKADGFTWNKIPFIFIGSQNNDPNVDQPPLYDIAEVNVAHYRNSADYEESSFMVGQPTPWAAGLTQAWVDANMKTGVIIGSRAFLNLPEGGSAGLLQADPNQMPSKGMEIKEEQMIRIGARLIQDNTGNETAEAAKIRFAGQNSKLGALVGNIEAAFKQAIQWAGWFMGVDIAAADDIKLELNRDFFEATLDPQMLIAEMQMLDRGVIAKTDVRGSLRRAGRIDKDRSDEQIDTEAESASPMIGGGE